MTTAAILRAAETVTPVDFEETVPLLFDYSVMAPGDVFNGAPVLTCELLSGEDSNPTSRLTGAVQVSDLQAVQLVSTLQKGATYLVRCKATMASGLVLVQAMEVPCIKVGATA